MKKLLFVLLLIAFQFVNAQKKRVLTLEKCIAIAIENNLTVQRSKLNLAISEVNLMQARGRRYPTLNARGNYGFNWGRGIDPTTNQFTTQRINFNGVGVGTSMPIISGLQTTNIIKQNKIDLEVSKFDLEKTVNGVSLNTALLYFNVIFSRELLEQSNSRLESGNRQLERTKKLVESGVLPRSDGLEFISQVATNEVNLITAQNNLDLALLDLRQSLLIPPDEQIDILISEIEVDNVEIESASVEDIYEIAIQNQPEIKEVDLRVKSAELELKVSKGAAYPGLDLNGSINTNYSDALRAPNTNSIRFAGTSPTRFQTASGETILQQNFDVDFNTVSLRDQYKDNLSRSFSLSLSIPIINGFNTRSSVQRSKIALRQAEIATVEQRNILRQNIESAYGNAQAAAKTFFASQRQVEALEETLRTIENKYTSGVANFTDYQVASNNLFQARSDLSRAKYDFIFRQKILDFYQNKPLTF